VEPAEPATRPTLGKSGGRSPRDMVLSMAVLLVPIALLLIFYRVVLNGDAPTTVDPGAAIEEAQSAKAFPVAVPANLGGGWHVVSARFQRQAAGATLRIGYVDPDKNGLQLIESNVPPATLLPAELTTTAKPVDTFRADARVWRRYDARPGEQALVFTEPNRTLIVIGDAGSRHLETLAAALP
jgi:Protein of unknown function (DUF4245)